MRKRDKKKPGMQPVLSRMPYELVELCSKFEPECVSKDLPGGAISVVLFCDRNLPTIEDASTLIAAQIAALEEIAALYRKQFLKDGAH